MMYGFTRRASRAMSSGSENMLCKHPNALRLSTINSKLVDMQYAVRGEIVLRAAQIESRIEEYPFDSVLYCNIGNPHSVGQTPITYVRQVLAGCMYPELLKSDVLPKQVCEKVQELLDGTKGHGLGAYSESKGLAVIRKSVADFIERRDGHPANPDHVFITNGASDGVKLILGMLIRNPPKDGILIPIPQYPLYSASITLLGGTQIPYMLNEDDAWSMDPKEIKKRIEDARADGVCVRALAVINPGNPTGQVMSYENIAEIVKLCEAEGIVLMADEVYQENVYNPEQKPFVSFKKVVRDLKSTVELVSYHSVSKGMLGECGMRGGYMELVNMHPEIVDVAYKAVSVSLCSNLPGQITVGLMTSPPKQGDESFPLYNKEVNQVFESLKRKSAKLVTALNRLDGVTCNASEGAMYVFPSFTLPAKAIAAAEAKGVSPCTFYCMDLLEKTGLCVVPGAGFGQKEDTFHFRSTFLPPEEHLDEIVDRMEVFHNAFLAKYK